MPKYEITSPDGRKFEITAPEGATQDEVLAYAKQQFSITPVEEKKKEGGGVLDYATMIGREAKQGMSLGFADEIQDVLGSGAAYLLLGGKKPYSDLLNSARARSQSELTKDFEEHPISTIAAQIAGSVPMMVGNPVNAGKAGTNALRNFNTGLQNWAASGGRLARAGKGGAIGAGYGAAYGAGAAGDTAEDRLSGAGLGGSLGLIGGGIGGSLGRVAKTSASQTIPDIQRAVAQNAAEKDFIKSIGMRNNLDQLSAEALARYNAAKKLGVELTMPEAFAQSPSDPALARLALLSQHPATTGDVQNIIAQRVGSGTKEGTISGAINDVASQIYPESYDAALMKVQNEAKRGGQAITDTLTKEAEPLYAEAMKKNIPLKKYKELLDKNPIVDRYVEKALQGKDPSLLNQVYKKPEPIYPDVNDTLLAMIKESGVYTPPMTPNRNKSNSVAVLDAAKKLIDKDLNNMGSNPPADPAALASAKRALVDVVDKYAPTYKQARDVYSRQPKILEQREMLGALADVDPTKRERVLQELFLRTPATTASISEALGGEGSKAAASAYLRKMGMDTRVGGKPRVIDSATLGRLIEYAGEGKDKPLTDLVDTIGRSKYIDRYMQGSPTQPLTNENAAMYGKQALGALLDAKTGNIPALVGKALDKVTSKMNDVQREQFARDTLRLFTTQRGWDLLKAAAKQQKVSISDTSSRMRLMGEVAAREFGLLSGSENR